MMHLENRPENWFKWTLAALAIVGLFVLGSMSNIVSDSETAEPAGSPSSPRGWQTYRSEVLGLQVAYPGEWSVVHDPVIESSVSFANPNDLSESLRIYAVAPDAEGLIREALASFSAKAIKIGGQPGVMYKNTGIDGTTSKVALVNFDGKLYYIGGNSADFEELLEQVSFFNN